MTTDQLDSHAHCDHIAAIFHDREAAEVAVRALRAQGFGSEHLSLAVLEDDPVVFERDADSKLVDAAVTGVATGAPLGAVAGIAIAAIGTDQAQP